MTPLSERFNSFLAIIYLVICGFGVLFIYIGLSAPFGAWDIWFLLAGVVIVVPFVLYFIYQNRQFAKHADQREKNLEAFKLKADQVKVPLDKLEIKSNNWSRDVVIDHSKYAGLNDLVGEGQRILKKVEHNLTSIVFEIPYHGKIFRHTGVFAMDEKTLLMYLAMKGETICYVNPNNPKEFYLDLEFLDSDENEA